VQLGVDFAAYSFGYTIDTPFFIRHALTAEYQ
jgi:hypothetical protein